MSVGGQESGPRPAVPLAFLRAVPADAEVVRLLAGVERGARAEPLVARVVVRQRVPDRLDGRRVGALDDEGRVRLAALDGVVHAVHSLVVAGWLRKAPRRSRRRSAGSRCRLIQSAAGSSAPGTSW